MTIKLFCGAMIVAICAAACFLGGCLSTYQLGKDGDDIWIKLLVITYGGAFALLIGICRMTYGVLWTAM